MKEVVYIVINGEQNEGGDVVSVHRSLNFAKAAALKVKTHFMNG
jgi:hypothetical protein